jgi:beta-lactamase superfamily II metal-dependent hydrolase
MSIIKSFSVGNGDMFYINHNSNNFSIIDCNIDESNQQYIVSEIMNEMKNKEISRFISTHPDEDHIHGLKYLDSKIKILNFYCVKNEANKDEITDDFKMYKELRDDSKKSFYLSKSCKRCWMNSNDKEKKYGCSGINILWPIIGNIYFDQELESVKEKNSPNNISPIIEYSLENGARVLWFGDLENSFMESILNEIVLPEADIIFAPHHGRKSGKIPNKWLNQINPKIVIIGEAPSDSINYYSGYNTITQNSAGDIVLDCKSNLVNIYVSKDSYTLDFLANNNLNNNYQCNYLGTLDLN